MLTLDEKVEALIALGMAESDYRLHIRRLKAHKASDDHIKFWEKKLETLLAVRQKISEIYPFMPGVKRGNANKKSPAI